MKKKPKPPSTTDRRRLGRRTEDVGLPNFRDMIENAVQGILVHSNFKPLYANASFAKLYGYKTPEEILSLPLIRPLYPLDIWPEVEEDYDELIRGKKMSQISRTRGVRCDGKEIWLSTTRRAIDWHGQPAVQISTFDIGAQVALEQVLLGNEQLLRSLLETLPVPVYISRRRDGRILFVNRKSCLLLQQSAGPLLKSYAQDFFVDPQEQEKIYQLVDSVHDVREVEAQLRTAQGRVFTAEIAAILMEYAGEPAILFSMNDISERKKLEAELFYQANTDSLTGLSNRRHFMFQAEQEVRRARRFSRDLSVIMMDLDHFKKINDMFGHATGDAVLEMLTRAGLESLRESDIMGRVGGEEFAIILPETGLVAAKEVAERLLAHIAETPIKIKEKSLHCTTSLGVAHLKPKESSIDNLLHRADQALYKAKKAGRNCVKTQGR